MCDYETSRLQPRRRSSAPTAGRPLAGATWGDATAVCRWGWSRAPDSVDITVMGVRGERENVLCLERHSPASIAGGGPRGTEKRRGPRGRPRLTASSRRQSRRNRRSPRAKPNGMSLPRNAVFGWRLVALQSPLPRRDARVRQPALLRPSIITRIHSRPPCTLRGAALVQTVIAGVSLGGCRDDSSM